MIGAKPSPRALRSYAAIVGLWALVVSAAPALAQPCCGPITPDGRRLAAFLNSTGVDHLWIAGHHIAWDTGQEDAGRPDGREEKTIAAPSPPPSPRGSAFTCCDRPIMNRNCWRTPR